MLKDLKTPFEWNLGTLLSGTARASLVRSRRVELRIPVHLRQDASEWFAVASVVNRGGALLRSPRPCAPDSRVRIMNTETGESAVFRVVWCGESASDRYELGVALADPRPNYWGAAYESVLASDDTLPPRGRKRSS